MKRSILVGTALACLFVLLAADVAQAQRRGFNVGSNGINWGTNTWGGNQGGGWNQSPYGGYGYGQPSTYSWPGTYNGNQGYYHGYQPSYNSGYYTQPNSGYYYNQPSFNGGYYSQPAGFQSQPSFSGAYTSTDNNNQYQSFYSGPGQQGDGTQALIRVLVPAPNTRVWIENQEMQQQGGSERVFISPPLQRGSNFVYHVKATWDQNGQQVTRERKIPVQAGQQVTANFMEGEQGQRTQQDGQQSQTQPADERNRSNNQAQPAQSGTRQGAQDQNRQQTPQRPKE